MTDRVVEEGRILEDRGKLRPERTESEVAYVRTVYADGSGARIVEASQEIHHRGFPGTRMPYQRGLVASSEFQGNLGQYLAFGVGVLERDAFVLERFADSLEIDLPTVGFGRRVQHFPIFRVIGRMADQIPVTRLQLQERTGKFPGDGYEKHDISERKSSSRVEIQRGQHHGYGYEQMDRLPSRFEKRPIDAHSALRSRRKADSRLDGLDVETDTREQLYDQDVQQAVSGSGVHRIPFVARALLRPMCL